jgi:hypothetical protein
MYFRGLTVDDLGPALRIHPELLGQANYPPGTICKIWKDLLSAPGFKGVAIVKPMTDGSEMFAGVGASSFVDEAFAQRELAQPAPGFNGRVILNALRPHSVALTRSKIAECNSNEGVTVAVLAGRWHPGFTAQEDIEEACLHLATSFASLHAGYRFRRVIVELNSDSDWQFYSNLPLMRVHGEFGPKRGFAIVEKADVLANQGSVLGPNFMTPLPKIYLRHAEQELLICALDGATDDDLERQLNLTRSAVKRRWAAIFTKVAQELPSLFPATGNADRTIRGPQKRHLVLAYVRKHPEELRPFVRTTAAKR